MTAPLISLLMKRDKLELAKDLACHAKDNARLQDELLCANRELFWIKALERSSIPIEDLIKLLPGTYYMNPPDGGSPTVLEQLNRMAEDAWKYRELSK